MQLASLANFLVEASISMAELIWKGKPKPSQRGSEDEECQHEPACSPSSYQLITKERHLPSPGEATMPETLFPEDQDNRLVWGDKSVVLPALLHEFDGCIDLIYI